MFEILSEAFNVSVVQLRAPLFCSYFSFYI